MLPIRRGHEPTTLKEQRWWRLARARVHILAALTTEGLEIAGYDVAPVKKTLHIQQHKKCAYCDRLHETTSQPIEHFRPKKGAIRSGGTKDELCYWWLAWSWENLLFSCSACNSQAYKGNHFPLSIDRPLAAESIALGDEDAALVDPAREHPMDHIQFRFDGERWTPEGKTDKGRTTIEVFGLNRPALLEYYGKLASDVEASLNDLKHAMERHDSAHLLDLWQRRLTHLLGHPQKTDFLRAEYAALIWDMFDQTFPKDIRDAHNLPLPRPGRRLTDDPPPSDHPTPPSWASFTPETIWALRALGKREAKPVAGKKSKSYDAFQRHMRDALVAVLGKFSTATSATALCALLDHGPFKYQDQDIQTALDALLAEGRVIRDPADLWSLAPPTP
jgi:uncharacterized protein (TIGR02646 family)